MMISTRNDKGTALEILVRWLTGAGFSGFRFDTSFSLFFYRDVSASYMGSELPCASELHLLGDWWVGSTGEWHDKVDKLGVGIEPDEPVKAYELTKLRWSEGTRVKNVSLSENVLAIAFQDETICIAMQTDDEYAILLKEPGVNEEEAQWSVTCVNESCFCRCPDAPRRA